ncbi:MAG: transferase hexapeptide repeat family protein [Planctomycetes bacterium]|jgi:phenylacetic acid degradation protein|nr:transferase hexapeptide repeat family protein [Planctomycetota bacterium]MCP4837959.1 transferase hexapeptide repeat family protein [Planctomycetota bacterium]
MPCYEYEGVRPVIDEKAFVHPSAVLIGDVIIGAHCLVGPAAVLRGDIGRIELKPGSNVQDSCVVHSFPGKDVLVCENGHVGHGAVLHGCTVGRNALVGMNAVLMDDVVVGENSMVGALSFVRERTEIPPGTLWAGTPARQIRELEEREVTWKSRGTEIYQRLAERHRETGIEVDPLAIADANRLAQRVPEVMYETKRAAGESE